MKASGNASYELSTRTYEKKGQAALATLYEKYLLGEIKQQEWKEASLKNWKISGISDVIIETTADRGIHL